MAFWLTATGLAVIVTGFLLAALLRARGTVAAPDSDLGIYRDQLSEVGRDLERGVLVEADAERARTEISRRILEADSAARARAAPARAPAAANAAAAGLTALLLIGGAAGLYLTLGTEGARDEPRRGRLEAIEAAARARPSQAVAEASTPESTHLPEGAPEGYLEQLQRLRNEVAAHPDDVEGNAILARHEAGLGHFRAAYAATQRLIDATGDEAGAQDYSQLAELMVMAAGGYVSPEAEAALRTTLTMDAGDLRARYYSGLMFAQSGRFDRAFSLWQGLLRDSPPDTRWLAPIRARMPDLARLAGRRYDAASLVPAPAATRAEAGDAAGAEAAAGAQPEAGADAAAISQLPADERDAMIRTMVARLATRLEAGGGSADDWAKLITSYAVLGEAQKAAAALTSAEAAFAGDTPALAKLREAALRAGLDE